MQPGALRALEFDRIVEAVKTFALTPMGTERLARLQPSLDPHEIADLLAHTTEAARFLGAQGALPLRASEDLPQIFVGLAVDGRALEAEQLLAFVAFLESVDETRTAIRRAPGSFPRLEAISGGAASFKGEIDGTRNKIDLSGEVVDHASPELKIIRERLRKQRTTLRSTLESYLRGKETAKHLQDQVVTERNGRYVLVVKSKHRSALPGIVHGSSNSGASLFLEPLSTVEINNDIVALEEQEREEIWRILLALTDAFRGRPIDIRLTVEAAIKLDVVQARARFSESVDGIEPALATDGRFELLAARHPLLARPVPVTIKVVPPATVLLVTGPNTGGKTVALKTAGLLALMAQAGLRIPAADGSRVPVFQSLFADIGDEQSIEASLSTFSGHIANIVSMDCSLVAPALILLDEVGSGTDPIEGGALGVAVIDHFRQRGATIIATSHYDQLKTYASISEGVTSAAFGFDADSFEPTYQLIYGSPGRSLALEIAGRLGLNATVVANARANLSAREAQLADHLAKIDHDMQALESERRLAAREREEVDAAGERMRQREETFRHRLNQELDTRVQQARREIDVVIAELKAKTTAIAKEASRQAVSTGDTGAARGKARATVNQIATRLQSPSAPSPSRSSAGGLEPKVGDLVVVGAFKLEGMVTALRDDIAEVDVRGKRMRTSSHDLNVIDARNGPLKERVTVNLELQPRVATPSDLNVVGCSVDEAVTRAERFLDESLLTDRRTIRLIHGYGTGQLKRALSGFLQQHPLVVRFANAPPDQGGGGVTIVELKD